MDSTRKKPEWEAAIGPRFVGTAPSGLDPRTLRWVADRLIVQAEREEVGFYKGYAYDVRERASALRSLARAILKEVTE